MFKRFLSVLFAVTKGNDFAALGHLALASASLNGIFHYNTKTLTPTGMHMTYFLHGIIGLLNSQSKPLRIDVSKHYSRSLPAAKYLGIACLMADLWSREPGENKKLPTLHFISGLLPFFLSIIGKENKCVSRLAILFNILSLALYASKKKNTWAWLTLNFAVFTYYITPIHEAIKCSCTFASGMMFPFGLAMTEICATRLFQGAPDPAYIK